MKNRNSSSILLILLFLFLSSLAILMVFHIKLRPFSVANIVTPSLTTILDSNTVNAEQERTNLRDPLRKENYSVPLPQSQRMIKCDRSHKSYDICSMNGPTVLDPTSSTFFFAKPTTTPVVEKIRPYPRKSENDTMARIKQFTLISGPSPPQCQIQHNVPALVFSAGGYTGNFFHDLSDGFIPLFITINSMFDQNQDFVLVVSQACEWWVNRYGNLLRIITKHPIIYLDNNNDVSTHCFTSATIGIISHGYMKVDSAWLPHPKTLSDFRSLLDKAYGGNINRANVTLSGSPKTRRPRLVFLSRPGGIGRVLLNEEEAKRVAEQIGFEVVVFEPKASTPLSEVYALISSSQAMVGVHGAALTHLIFLRAGSVFVQVVPLGTEWAAEVCYGMPAKAVGLEYMEYRIDAEESTLLEKYDRNDLVIKDPIAFRGEDWSAMKVYLKEQNVKLNMTRFMEYLKEAYRIANKVM